MSVSSDIVTDDAQAYAEALGGEWNIDDERFSALRKLLKAAANEVEEVVVWRLQDDLHGHLANKVREFATRAIEAVLNGNEDELRRWLACGKRSWTGRGTYANGESVHSVHDGKLFETGALQLRKKIVEAHPQLLRDERVLDLEDQLQALLQKLNKANARIEEQNLELAERRR